MIGETTRPLLSLREDPLLPERIARSAAAPSGVTPDTQAVLDWLDRRRDQTLFTVERIPFEELDGWSFDERTGDLRHRSGRFFTIEGLHVRAGDPPSAEWWQPIICQLEIGILGIVAKEFDGVLHFLMQAKMEPGNPNLLELSPTVQATRSNYTKVHRGAAVRYLEYFTRPGRSRVLSDVLQSEHGSWFYRKRNRNMIVEITADVPEHEDFRWLTLGQIAELLHLDNVINMDARSVLAGLPGEGVSCALHSDTELLSWLTSAAGTVRAERVPLASVPGWARGEYSIEHEEGRYFRVMAVSVRADNREVAQWTQPLFEPVEPGIVAFLARDIGNVPHVLASARAEGGFLGTAQLGPTVQCLPGNHAHRRPQDRPAFLDIVTAADPSRVRYSAVHSDEGGRFLSSVSRHLVIDADAGQAPLDPPPGFRWVSHGQLGSLARRGEYVNVQARTLLTCLDALAARTAGSGTALRQ